MRVVEIFWRFFLLGLVSFGGPAAHIGYFHTLFVQKLRWLDDSAYARLIALSQFLPGPGSSQIGFAIGLQRAGIIGAIAAFVGFTAPSFALMYALATLKFESTDIFTAVIHGLKLVAVVVVADAVLSMYRSFCTSTASLSLALFSAVMLWLFPSLWAQVGVLIVAALIGASVLKSEPKPLVTSHTKPSFFPLILFMVLFVGLPFLANTSVWVGLFNTFYQSGSLVFGGGHVVLPLLQQSLGDTISTERFLFGYASAQAVPGPMFTFATFLGADLSPASPLLGALIATLAIFLPGFLLVLGLYTTWESLSSRPRIAGAAAGINAAVVGLLIAALYNPVFVSAVLSPIDMAIVLMGFYLLRVVKIPIIGIIALISIISISRNLL
jgi:chromate transporter